MPEIEPICILTPGISEFPKAILAAPDGACAEIYLHGGHLTSWIPAGGEEQIFLSQTAEFTAKSAIRGGVPVIFPQFADTGPLAKHGFARRAEWMFANAESTAEGVTARFELRDSSQTRAAWPYPFLLTLKVTLSGRRLDLKLTVANNGKEPMRFSGALHTYFRVSELNQVTIAGLKGCRYRIAPQAPSEFIQAEEMLTFGTDEFTRMYLGSPKQFTLHDAGRVLKIETYGFPDTVVWNPGKVGGAAQSDLEPDGYRRFFCLEPAIVANPQEVAPFDTWSGGQTLILE